MLAEMEPVTKVQESSATPDDAKRLRQFAKAYAVDSVMRCGTHVVARLWAEDAKSFNRIAVYVDGQKVQPSLATTIMYPRRDAEQVAGPTVCGLTVLVRDPSFVGQVEISVVLINEMGEVLPINGSHAETPFPTFVSGIFFDLERNGLEIETSLLFDKSKMLAKAISDCWAEYLADIKPNHTTISDSSLGASYSIITVFYRKTFLANIFPIAANIMNLPREAEVILCFQEAEIFAPQIAYLEELFKVLKIKYKLILFKENVGFSAANNVAVENARSEVCVLVNPDIFCSNPAIYGKIAKRAISNKGIVGATLLSDADEIMHNGIALHQQTAFHRGDTAQIIRTSHVGRHTPKSGIVEGAVCPAQAVSGAILGFTRDLWRSVGGLPERFVLAHFEDVQFCLDAASLGAAVEVYQTKGLIHLESYGSGGAGFVKNIKHVNSVLFSQGVK